MAAVVGEEAGTFAERTSDEVGTFDEVGKIAAVVGRIAAVGEMSSGAVP